MRTTHLSLLRSQIQEQQLGLALLSDQEMQKTLGPGLWSGKEILGHLLDSAAMNRQRIVRARYEEIYEFPSYNVAQWVSIQSYQQCVWRDLVAHYRSAYQHLVHVLEHFPDETRYGKCPVKFSSGDYVTLDWLVGHIYRHSDHHLRQVFWLVGKSDLPDERVLNRPIEELP